MWNFSLPGMPIHCGVAEPTEETQREEMRRPTEEEKRTLSFSLCSLRFLCGLCDSAVNRRTNFN